MLQGMAIKKEEDEEENDKRLFELKEILKVNYSRLSFDAYQTVEMEIMQALGT